MADKVTPEIAQEILQIMDRADRDQAFVDSLVMEDVAISGTRYKWNWNNKPSKER